MFNTYIDRLRKVENSAKKLTIELGLGESIHQIINNIINDKIKEDYKVLVNSITDEVVTKIEWINNHKLQGFIFDNKQDDTYERVIQAVINLYEEKQLSKEIINSIVNMVGYNKFTEHLHVSLEAALVRSTYNEDRNKLNMRYKISNELDYRCYQVAISTYGMYFVYSNIDKILSYKIDERKYGLMLDNMLSNGVGFDEEYVSELSQLFGNIIKFKEQNRYRKYISDVNQEEYNNILSRLDNIENLIQAGFNRERRDFWKDYLLLGKFENIPNAKILIIKFDNMFIIEQGRDQGYSYIMHNSRYNELVNSLAYEDSESVGSYLYNIKLSHVEKRLTHTAGWKSKFIKVLSDYNVSNSKIMKNAYNRIKEERRKMTPSLRYKILARDKYTCHYCKCLLSKERFHIDHLYPISRGGYTEERNLVASCVECNLRKGAKTAEEFMKGANHD